MKALSISRLKSEAPGFGFGAEIEVVQPLFIAKGAILS
jgi:hypothetical protein